MTSDTGRTAPHEKSGVCRLEPNAKPQAASQGFRRLERAAKVLLLTVDHTLFNLDDGAGMKCVEDIDDQRDILCGQFLQ